jgi:hypothetical protein
MSKRKNKISGELGVFLQQYARKAHAGWDPNDRTYDRELEKKIKAMSAEELGELMAGQDESLTIDEENEWYSQSLVPGLCYRLNDPVQVTLGGSTKMGSIVSLLAIRPLPKYLVELSDGTDIEVYENGIKPSNHQTHNKCMLSDLGKQSPFLQKDAKKPLVHPSRKCRRYEKELPH